MFNHWLQLTLDTTRLAIESQNVIALRLLKMLQGGAAAQAEAVRMLAEKAAASAEALGTVALGGTPARVVKKYRRRVNANARRLRGRSK